MLRGPGASARDMLSLSALAEISKFPLFRLKLNTSSSARSLPKSEKSVSPCKMESYG